MPRIIARSDTSVPVSERPATVPPSSSWNGFQPNPYVDYGRFLTREGGVLIVYKDIDPRFRHTLLRLFLWSVATLSEARLLFGHMPPHNIWLNIACLVVVAIINWITVAKPIELYRAIEIRPDCMILEGSEVFWLRNMERGWPAFRPDEDGNQILSGIYGTRFVDYLTVRKFHEHDRMPEVLASHLQDAMQQLWAWPF